MTSAAEECSSLGDYDVTELGFNETVRVNQCGSHHQAAEEAALWDTDWSKRIDVEKIKVSVRCLRTGIVKVFEVRLEPSMVELKEG